MAGIAFDFLTRIKTTVRKLIAYNKSMFSYSLFAAIQKLNVDPETMHQINVIGIGTFVLIFIALLGILAWHGVPFFYSYNRNRLEEKHRTSNAIWFDSNDSNYTVAIAKSVLNQGHLSILFVS